MAKTKKTKTKAKKPAPVAETLRRLRNAYPDARCTLDFTTPLQLMVATILSAQCTDQRVNTVTPDLFKKYPTARDFAHADPDELQADIRSTGFFRNKARSIQAACRVIVDEHRSRVPTDIDALVRLPGVGRKTANVILGNTGHDPGGVVVDTHVGRLARRLGWSAQTDAIKVERDLAELIPRPDWVRVGHELILHGRRICTARNPRCPDCPLADLCPSASTRPP